jgi:hypothetical protein
MRGISGANVPEQAQQGRSQSRVIHPPGKEPRLSTELFRNRTSNLGLVTQNIQWLLLLGIPFVVTVFLQTVRGYNAIQTGVVFTAATVGILVSSLAAERLAGRRVQKTLILAGFVTTIAGIALLIGQVVTLPRGAAGGDLGLVAQRLQPGLVAGHRHRRHHPGVRPGRGEHPMPWQWPPWPRSD